MQDSLLIRLICNKVPVFYILRRHQRSNPLMSLHWNRNYINILNRYCITFYLVFGAVTITHAEYSLCDNRTTTHELIFYQYDSGFKSQEKAFSAFPSNLFVFPTALFKALCESNSMGWNASWGLLPSVCSADVLFSYPPCSYLL